MEGIDKGEELLQRAMSLRQQSEEIEQQLQFVSEQIGELQKFRESLQTLQAAEDEEILSNMGKGIFMKVVRKKEEKLFVEVGAGVVVRKTPKEAIEVVTGQIHKFQEAKMHLTSQLQMHAEEFRKMLKEVEGIRN